MASRKNLRALRTNLEFNEILNVSDSDASETSESSESESHPSDCECGLSDSENNSSKRDIENTTPAAKRPRATLATLSDNKIFDRPDSPPVQNAIPNAVNHNYRYKVWSNGINYVPKTFNFDTCDSGIPFKEKLPVDAAQVEYFKQIWQTSIIQRIALE
jgi:hypothetical protein